MNKDLEIAQQAKLEDISVIADKAGIDQKYLLPYGKNKAKVSLELKDKQGKVLASAQSSNFVNQ